ncbi:RNA pyrophosphohydrolase [Methylobacterium gregans]|uniref:RNA pyrophosphohydrolase n=1 Tax=Methylobacterium gregans TaxID=374424 RepID=A0AA37MCE1_9HYPH|nr:RNA pyrophosphohydrolase [Methylobacterium gregans]MDQ0524062.1 putative (di)nucleoside polyphosphate hydrolase [Methylobacterium gregans]GJD81092.1 RNA pyrophosphohydrolase [Methylobacterium gregans]GLS56651.1 RNA pyrophosphohydrolase [Methylobacterium gregans]
MTSAPLLGHEAPLPYRPCVGVALINRAGGVFVGRRKDADRVGAAVHAWQMPQGGIDDGEAAAAAAVRELHEETNVSPALIRPLGEVPDWLPYDLPADLMKQAWKGRYRGQTQKWFAFAFLGTDEAIDVNHPGGGAHKAEFDAWRWAAFDELPGLVVPFKRPVYEAVVTAFAPLASWARSA